MYFFMENERSYDPLSFREDRMSGKNPVLVKKGKKGKSGRGSLANRVQNERFTTYLEFGSSDFDETFRKCSSYEKNED